MTCFGKGDIDFSDAQFSEGDITFSNAEFGEGSISFKRASFGKGDCLFSPQDIGPIKKLDFSDTSFDGTLTIAGLESPVPLNLCHARLSHPLDLHNTIMNFRKEPLLLLFEKAADDLI